MVLISFSLILVSYSKAKSIASDTMEPTKPDFYITECNFSALFFYDGRPVDRITGFGWQVLFNTDKYFTNNLEIYVSLTGEIVGTNPTDLRERIKTKVAKEEDS